MTEKSRVLGTYWHPARGDNFTTATDVGRKSAAAAGYTYVRDDGLIYDEQVKGAVPLTLFWSPARQDNYTAPPVGAGAATAAGYETARVEGFVLSTMPAGPHTRLRSWWNSKRGDNFLTGSLHGDREAEKSGYERVRLADGYGPAARNIKVTRRSKPGQIEKFVTGVAFWFDGEAFTPNGMVYSEAISFEPGLPWPEHALGSVRADAQGRIQDLSLGTTRENLPDVPWTGIIIDAESCTEISVGPIY